MNITAYTELNTWCANRGVTLVAVSKTHTVEAIMALYRQGHRHFGENKVQELLPKYEALPKDIKWHFIGHLQSNKVKLIASFIYLVHSVDSIDLLKELDKQALKHNQIIDYLLQIHIAEEETKYGLDDAELNALLNSSTWAALKNTRIRGLMGMATHTDDTTLVHQEFRHLKNLFDRLTGDITNGHIDTLSMGMSADYALAVEEGSTLIRVGSLLFGERDYSNK